MLKVYQLYLWYYNVQQLLKIVITQVRRINFPTDWSHFSN